MSRKNPKTERTGRGRKRRKREENSRRRKKGDWKRERGDQEENVEGERVLQSMKIYDDS